MSSVHDVKSRKPWICLSALAQCRGSITSFEILLDAANNPCYRYTRLFHPFPSNCVVGRSSNPGFLFRRGTQPSRYLKQQVPNCSTRPSLVMGGKMKHVQYFLKYGETEMTDAPGTSASSCGGDCRIVQYTAEPCDFAPCGWISAERLQGHMATILVSGEWDSSQSNAIVSGCPRHFPIKFNRSAGRLTLLTRLH